MPEEKKATRIKKMAAESAPSGLLLEIVFRSIQSFVDGAIENVHQAMHAFARKIMRRTMAFFFSLFGFVFIFMGLARLLNAVYPIPGIGEATVGVFMLFLALLMYVLSQEK